MANDLPLESLDNIEAEIRARAKAWNEPTLAQYDERLADRIHAAHERIRHALDVCVKQMCANCREAAHKLDPDAPCVYGCETLRIAKEALQESEVAK